MKITLTTLAALAVCATTLTVHAADPEPKKGRDPEAMFKKMDKDSDGFVSKEEFLAGRKDPAKAEAMFTKRDTNADGKLSPDEAMPKPMHAKKGSTTTPADNSPVDKTSDKSGTSTSASEAAAEAK